MMQTTKKQWILGFCLLGLGGISTGFALDTQLIYNDTDNPLELTLGYFLKSTYTIKAHSSRTILLSTDNPTIHIRSVKADTKK